MFLTLARRAAPGHLISEELAEHGVVEQRIVAAAGLGDARGGDVDDGRHGSFDDGRKSGIQRAGILGADRTDVDWDGPTAQTE
jgi:hypothetical protein